jgi:hypothetical protein
MHTKLRVVTKENYLSVTMSFPSGAEIEEVDESVKDALSVYDDIQQPEVETSFAASSEPFDREKARKALHDRIKGMKQARSGQTRRGLGAEINQTMSSKDRRKAERQVQTKSVEDILSEFGITSTDAKAKVVDAMRSGRLKTLNDLVQYLAGLGGTMPANANELYYGGAGKSNTTSVGASTGITMSGGSGSGSGAPPPKSALDWTRETEAVQATDSTTPAHISGEARSALKPPTLPALGK